MINVLDENDVILARIGRKSNKVNRQFGVQTDTNNDGTIHDDDSDNNNKGGSLFGIIPRLERYKKENGIIPKCQILKWSTGKELHSHITKLLKEENK